MNKEQKKINYLVQQTKQIIQRGSNIAELKELYKMMNCKRNKKYLRLQLFLAELDTQIFELELDATNK